MPSGLSAILSNPLVQANMVANLGRGLVGLYGTYEQGSRQRQLQDVLAQSEASGAVPTTIPRRGLSGLIAKTGLISPDEQVDPTISNIATAQLQERQAKLLGPAIAAYSQIGPTALNAPMFKGLGLSSLIAQGGAAPDAISALAKQVGMDPAAIAALPPAQRQFVLNQARQEQTHRDLLAQQQQAAQREERFHAEREADVASTRAATAEARAQTQAIASATEQDRRQAERDRQENAKATEQDRRQAERDRQENAKATQKIESERNQDARDRAVEQQTKSLNDQRDKILADVGKATAGTDFKARVAGHNASAALFYRRHAKSGAPTLLRYSETPTHAAGLIGGKPQVEAIPPTYGNYKGKTGWLDADSNFYPD